MYMLCVLALNLGLGWFNYQFFVEKFIKLTNTY